MSFVVVPKEIRQDRDLNPTDKLVYQSIRSFMNERTYKCFPSRQQIHEDSGVHPRSITGAIARLKSKGYFRVERQKNSSNLYTFPYHESKFTIP